MQKVVGGDKRQEFMRLYEPLHPRLNRFVHAQVWNSEDARDIISETVLQAFERLGSLKNPEAFLSYLFSIASRLIQKRIRRKKFWGIFNQEEADNLPESSLSIEELQCLELSRLLQKLRPEQREAITLFEISGFSIREIAALQLCSESAVKSRLSRARQKLSKLCVKAGTELNESTIVYKNLIS